MPIKSTDGELPSSTEKPCIRAASREARQEAHAFVVCRGGGSERAHQQHPRQKRRFKGEEAEKGHARLLVLARPDVDHHEGERGAEKGRRRDEGRRRAHERAAEAEHEREVDRAAAEGALLEKAAVAGEKEHVEEEVDAERAEEEKVGKQPPQLQLEDDELQIKVE